MHMCRFSEGWSLGPEASRAPFRPWYRFTILLHATWMEKTWGFSPRGNPTTEWGLFESGVPQMAF